MTKTKKLNLLDDDEDFNNDSNSNDTIISKNKNKMMSEGLTINTSYAARYEDRKRKQELSQLEDKYKAQLKNKGGYNSEEDDEDFEDSESDEEEDDEGELLTPAVDAQILKTLSEIRSRSEKVYDPAVKFFDESEIAKIDEEWRKKQHAGSSSKSKVKRDAKPAFTIKDFQREKILSGKALEEAQAENESDDENEGFNDESEPLTHVQEQEKLKAEMKKAFSVEGGENDANEDKTDEEGDGLLCIRVKSEEEIAREEEEYRNFLLENLATSENAKVSMSEWLSYREEHDGVSRKTGKSRKQMNDDDFLIDYVLNKGWVDKEATRIPSYDKVIEADLEDEEAEEQAEEFEMTHNFRYEQEGGTQIQTFSRTIEGSMRREDSSRKEQRKAAKERKAQAKLQKAEEIKRLKNLKMAEIKKRLEKITKKVPGEAEIEDLVDDLEADFDPEQHDRLMKKIIKDEQEDEGDEGDKPVFSSDSEIDYTSAEEESKPAVKKARKIIKKAVKSDGEQARLAKYLDELYTLDYEDLIGGDIPCRFKYQKVEPSTYGLTMDEILTADDTQLNTFFSLKKMAPYRPHERQELDIKKYANKKRLYKFRQDLRDGFNRNYKKDDKDKDKDKERERDEGIINTTNNSKKTKKQH